MMTGKKKTLLIIATAAILAAVVLLLLLLAPWDRVPAASTPPVDQKADASADETGMGLLRYDGKWYRQNDDIETVLLFGVDKFEDDIEDAVNYINQQRADFLMLLLWNKKTDDMTVMQLDRDTMAPVMQYGLLGDELGTEIMQLAVAHAYGTGGKDSCENTVDAVSNLLYGTEIDHYISLTMDAVALINDAVGGVTVTLLDDFTHIDPTWAQGEEVTLMGQQALTYVRNRMDMADPTNINRMARQRQYMEALYAQASGKVEADQDFTLKLMLQLNDYMTSDCSANYLTDLADLLSDAKEIAVETVAGESVVGEQFMEFYVDEEALQAQTIRLFYEEVKE